MEKSEKRSLIVWVHPRWRRVKWSERSTWWKWKRRSKLKRKSKRKRRQRNMFVRMDRRGRRENSSKGEKLERPRNESKRKIPAEKCGDTGKQKRRTTMWPKMKTRVKKRTRKEAKDDWLRERKNTWAAHVLGWQGVRRTESRLVTLEKEDGRTMRLELLDMADETELQWPEALDVEDEAKLRWSEEKETKGRRRLNRGPLWRQAKARTAMKLRTGMKL